MTTDSTPQTKGAGQYANVNGINLYYETHGKGRPMILLHGGLGSGEMFAPVLPQLSEHHQVIAVDLQGHGRTADIDRPIDIRLMADDVVALIDHLKLDKPDVVGYFPGGRRGRDKAAGNKTPRGRAPRALARRSRPSTRASPEARRRCPHRPAWLDGRTLRPDRAGVSRPFGGPPPGALGGSMPGRRSAEERPPGRADLRP